MAIREGGHFHLIGRHSKTEKKSRAIYLPMMAVKNVNHGSAFLFVFLMAASLESINDAAYFIQGNLGSSMNLPGRPSVQVHLH